jgi:hypothetical protein
VVIRGHLWSFVVTRVQRRRKHQKIGGAPASRGTLGYRKGHLKNFTGNVGDGGRGEGGRREKFSRRTIPKLHVFDHIVLKTWKFPNKKGTFDVKVVLYNKFSRFANFRKIQKPVHYTILHNIRWF